MCISYQTLMKSHTSFKLQFEGGHCLSSFKVLDIKFLRKSFMSEVIRGWSCFLQNQRNLRCQLVAKHVIMMRPQRNLFLYMILEFYFFSALQLFSYSWSIYLFDSCPLGGRTTPKLAVKCTAMKYHCLTKFTCSMCLINDEMTAYLHNLQTKSSIILCHVSDHLKGASPIFTDC